MAEDFAPFNIDVTTEYLGEAFLTRSSIGDQIYGTRALISPISSYFGNYGGIAYVNVFDSVGDTYKPALIFPENLGPNGEKYIAEAISHEVGHNLGLSHDGTATQGYYSGQGSGETGWAPIMGVGYYQPLSQWSKGEYIGANQKQDDLAIIASQSTYRSDASGNTAATASSLGVNGSNATYASLVDVFQFGIIETRSDLDWYGFTTGVGTISFSVGSITQAFINTGGSYLSSYVTAPGGSTNLDIWAGLYASNGTKLYESNPQYGLGASFSYDISIAGTYYLAIDGVGEGNPLMTGYSDYGSLGQYLISGTIVATAALPGIVVTPTSGLTTTEAGGTASFSVVLASAPTANVSISVSSTKTNEGTPDKSTLTFTTSNWNVAQTVIVTGVDDQLVDGPQPYAVTLTSASGDSAYQGVSSSVSLTNLDNDLPVLSLSSAQTMVEGLNTSVTYTVSLSSANPAGVTTTVSYATATANGTATAGFDYTATSGSLSFAAGETYKTITVALLNDNSYEADESFTLSLSAPTNAALGTPSSVTTTLTDTLVATSTTTLAAGIENLSLSGNAAIDGTGNSGANVITGNIAANLLKGGGGLDTLTGLDGTDSFDLSGISSAANRCTITDFNLDPVTGETIRLSDSLTSRSGSSASLASISGATTSYNLNTGPTGSDIFAFNFDSSATLAGVTNGTALLDGLIGSGSATLKTSTRGGKGYLLAYDNDNAFLYAFNAGGGNSTNSTTVSANEIALIGTFDNISAINPVDAFVQSNFNLV
ncbi:Calx-beta domain-containing protein [Cyanobium sp. ATX-6F1]|uniref:Calx-beta domain-containing protein n=1 Tax=Cyanobium sp. ATX-6F1 TaxID=3137388 RepID=UPI0039BEC448